MGATALEAERDAAISAPAEAIRQCGAATSATRIRRQLEAISFCAGAGPSRLAHWAAAVWKRRHGIASRSSKAMAAKSNVAINDSKTMAAMTRSVWNWAMARVSR